MPPVNLLTPHLVEQMRDFVQCFGVVKERQIRKFFSDWGVGEVEHILHHLIANGEITRHQEEYLSCCRRLPRYCPTTHPA